MPENGHEMAQTGLPNGPGCNATGAIWCSKCGPFASSKSPNGETRRLFRPFKSVSAFSLVDFCGSVFVKVVYIGWGTLIPEKWQTDKKIVA